MKSGVIVAVGDSLTEGFGVDADASWPALLEQRLRSEGFDYTVINSGRSGETSKETLARLDDILALHPDMVIVETGINDLMVSGNVSATRGNIAAILSRLRDHEIPVLLVGMRMVWMPSASGAGELNALYPELADEYDVVFMPFLLTGVALNPELNLSDAVHPNAAGYRIIAENIYPYVLKSLEQRQR